MLINNKKKNKEQRNTKEQTIKTNNTYYDFFAESSYSFEESNFVSESSFFGYLRCECPVLRFTTPKRKLFLIKVLPDRVERITIAYLSTLNKELFHSAVIQINGTDFIYLSGDIQKMEVSNLRDVVMLVPNL